MNRKKNISFLPWISLAFIFLALIITLMQLIRFSRFRSSFQAGTEIAGVSVGGLSRQEAADRLTQAYNLPVELHYDDAVIHLRPSNIGFKLDLEGMLALAEQERSNQPFWGAFWNFLWNQQTVSQQVPLRSDYSEERLRTYLNTEIKPRYDRSPTSAIPIAGGTSFEPGQPGSILNVDQAVLLIDQALRSPNRRVVNLTYNQTTPSLPAFENVRFMLEQILISNGFDGTAEIYLLDEQSRKELSFAMNNGVEIPPDVSFTAASTMKIPIMVSVYQRVSEPAPEEVTNLLELMIELSENDPADRLMEQIMDSTLGPLEVTDDMQALGLVNTFLGGYFYPGAPLLQRFTTPANSRTDVNTSPDAYSQTTPTDMGALLDDIYLCANQGGGTFGALYPNQITQAECRLMINYLEQNRIGVLLQAGLPEGTRIAHKHGWITENDGLIHTISDAGIIYTPGGTYIMVVFLHHPDQLLFDDANQLIARLSMGVYNYFNLSQ